MMLYAPSLLQLEFSGNSLIWDMTNFLTNVTSNRLFAKGNLEMKNLTVRPGVNFYQLTNYVYYDTYALPAQYSGSITIFSPEIEVKLNWKNIFLENYIQYSLVSPNEIINQPELFTYGRLYYQNKIFKKALLIQTGFDLFWKSKYFANHYMPVTQQFYLNDNFRIPSYVVSDFFINLQVKRATGFIKLSHFHQGFWGPGYFSTPFYPGMPRNFEFGIKWMFFD